MEISFDRVKRALCLAERGLDFADAGKVFDGLVFEFEDDRFVYPERRFVTYGLLNERLLAVVWTEMARGRRVISMRKANGREHAKYRGRLA